MMLQDNRSQTINPMIIPSSDDASANYRACGGHLTDPEDIVVDLISQDVNKSRIRHQSFTAKFPSFGIIFDNLVMAKWKCLGKHYYFT